MLFNVVKHAGTGQARLRLRRMRDQLCLTISDKGCGFNPRELQEAEGFGLLSTRQRVEMLGGRMGIRSTAGKGSTFRIVVPDQDPAGANAGSPEGIC